MSLPCGAIVNSIAPCHLENLVDLDGVAREKGCIYSHLAADGIAVFPAETAGKQILQSAAGNHKCVTFGINGNGDICAEFISGELDNSTFALTFPDGNKYIINWKLTGRHNALNAAGAAALAYSSGISPEIICEGLKNTTLPGMRMKKTILNQVTYFNDAYNANPASMTASIELL
jgi:UDP-N-acetylmuramoyl-tripeptide--D-alanyl-D-alanine ligase